MTDPYDVEITGWRWWWTMPLLMFVGLLAADYLGRVIFHG